MANIDPARYANEKEALRPHYPDPSRPRPPRKRRVHNVVRLFTGRRNKRDG